MTLSIQRYRLAAFLVGTAPYHDNPLRYCAYKNHSTWPPAGGGPGVDPVAYQRSST